MSAKVDEANAAATKIHESFQGILNKVKEEITAHKTETQTALHKLKKQIKANPKQIVVQEPEQTTVVNAETPKNANNDF